MSWGLLTREHLARLGGQLGTLLLTAPSAPLGALWAWAVPCLPQGPSSPHFSLVLWPWHFPITACLGVWAMWGSTAQVFAETPSDLGLPDVSSWLDQGCGFRKWAAEVTCPSCHILSGGYVVSTWHCFT